jgi:hypothetical protein
VLSKLTEVRRQVAIAGRVIDGDTRKPLAGALVNLVGELPPAMRRLLATKERQYGARWNDMTERPDRALTAADGLFYFMDLPDGNYTIAVSLAGAGKRYGSGQGSAVVSRDAQHNVRRDFPKMFLEIALRATSVQGKVNDSTRGGGVAMAEVRVQGSGEHAFSDSIGRYVLAAIEPGKRTLVVTAQGYPRVKQEVTIAGPGESVTHNFKLKREAAG